MTLKGRTKKRAENIPLAANILTINHLLVSCVFSHQVWFNILQRVGLQGLSSQPEDISFDD
jgi:hypothetical protein